MEAKELYDTYVTTLLKQQRQIKKWFNRVSSAEVVSYGRDSALLDEMREVVSKLADVLEVIPYDARKK